MGETSEKFLLYTRKGLLTKVLKSGNYSPGWIAANGLQVRSPLCVFMRCRNALFLIFFLPVAQKLPKTDKFNALHHIIQSIKKGRKPLILKDFQPLDATGFEPAASASRTQRSTKLSHASITALSCSENYYIIIVSESQPTFLSFVFLCTVNRYHSRVNLM